MSRLADPPTPAELYALFLPFCTRRELRKVCAAMATQASLRAAALDDPEERAAAAWWLAKREALDPPARKPRARKEPDHDG